MDGQKPAMEPSAGATTRRLCVLPSAHPERAPINCAEPPHWPLSHEAAALYVADGPPFRLGAPAESAQQRVFIPLRKAGLTHADRMAVPGAFPGRKMPPLSGRPNGRSGAPAQPARPSSPVPSSAMPAGSGTVAGARLVVAKRCQPVRSPSAVNRQNQPLPMPSK